MIFAASTLPLAPISSETLLHRQIYPTTAKQRINLIIYRKNLAHTTLKSFAIHQLRGTRFSARVVLFFGTICTVNVRKLLLVDSESDEFNRTGISGPAYPAVVLFRLELLETPLGGGNRPRMSTGVLTPPLWSVQIKL